MSCSIQSFLLCFPFTAFCRLLISSSPMPNCKQSSWTYNYHGNQANVNPNMNKQALCRAYTFRYQDTSFICLLIYLLGSAFQNSVTPKASTTPKPQWSYSPSSNSHSQSALWISAKRNGSVRACNTPRSQILTPRRSSGLQSTSASSHPQEG